MSVTVDRAHTLFVAGQWRDSDESVEVTSPYSGDTVAEVARGGAAETREAIDAADRALRESFPAHARARVLDDTARAIEANRDDLAELIALEAGKPLKASRVEVDRAVQTFTFGAVEARRLAGEMVPMDAHPAGGGHLAFTIRRPIGVVGAISPFNFPLNLVAHKLSPAIAAGCPVVLKPARSTPLAALRLAQLLEEAGLPAGYLSVVVGDSSEIGDVLVEDERVRLITFTGSAVVGWKLKARAVRKRVELELGNNSPAIVAADANLDQAADKLAPNAFFYAGQTCISVQRVFVERSVYDDFLERFLAGVEKLVVGDPVDPATDVGPLIAESERDRVLEWIGEARDDGAKIAAGGDLDGNLIRPTVLTNVDPRSKVAAQEVFGPVVTVDAVDSLDEGLERANATVYGLQAAVFTRDVAAAFRAAHALDYGGVLINESPSYRVDQMPYGGVKESGNTREGPHYAIEHMTEQKLVIVNLE